MGKRIWDILDLCKLFGWSTRGLNGTNQRQRKKHIVKHQLVCRTKLRSWVISNEAHAVTSTKFLDVIAPSSKRTERRQGLSPQIPEK